MMHLLRYMPPYKSLQSRLQHRMSNRSASCELDSLADCPEGGRVGILIRSGFRPALKNRSQTSVVLRIFDHVYPWPTGLDFLPSGVARGRAVVRRVICAFAISCAVAGCASVDPSPAPENNTGPSFADDYVIGIGDSLAVHVYGNENLSTSVPVRPDGKITVPIAGDIHVGGLTPERVSEEISARLEEYIRDPIVTTTVTNFGDSDYISRVRVTGAVGSPSSIPFRNGMTVLDVVLDAGGVTDFSNPGKTVIYRKDGVRLPVRLDRILKRGDLSTNYTLMPGDVISVPESLF